jgi:hypothetical protein
VCRPDTTAPFLSCSPAGKRSHLFTRLHLYIFVCFKGFMVAAEAWAQLVCTPATPLQLIAFA